MGARRIARERALQALYQLEISGGAPERALEDAWTAAEGEPETKALDPKGRAEAESFSQLLVSGVLEHLAALDELIDEHSHNWRVERMARVDRNVLRLAVFELRELQEVPKKVSLNEAIELGRSFGTENSSSFVNGLLDRIAVRLGKR